MKFQLRYGLHSIATGFRTLSWTCGLLCAVAAYGQESMRSFAVDTPSVHDPVMAFENGIYHLYSTGNGLSHYTSHDMKHWTGCRQGVITDIPQWTHDSVPGFTQHVWAPDIIQFNGRWYLSYACSYFGKNTSAIGLLSKSSLNSDEPWHDEGCILASRGGRDNWNAIDPNVIVAQDGTPWLAFGSFWDGIQLVRLDSSLHVAPGERPFTIARRYAPTHPNVADNPTSDEAGPNAIEAPFIYFHRGWYYLFVSWDYCCQGMKSTYRIAVGRSRQIMGPYLDSHGHDMLKGGGDILFEGDKKEFEAVGHCAVYTVKGKPMLICHGYSIAKGGTPVLVKRNLKFNAHGLSLAK